MPSKPQPKSKPVKPRPTPAKPVQTTLVPQDWGKKSRSGNGGFKGKPKPKPNGNIINFFQKAEEQNNKIFYEDRKAKYLPQSTNVNFEDADWENGFGGVIKDDDEARYNEREASIKKRRISEDNSTNDSAPLESQDETAIEQKNEPQITSLRPKSTKRVGPFIDDSDSEFDELEMPVKPSIIPSASDSLNGMQSKEKHIIQKQSADADVQVYGGAPGLEEVGVESTAEDTGPIKSDIMKPVETVTKQDDTASPAADRTTPKQDLLRSRQESIPELDGIDFDDFEGLDDEQFSEGEEHDERQWMAEQKQLEMAEAGFEGDLDDFDPPSLFKDDSCRTEDAAAACPLCSKSLIGLSEQEVSVHVNSCLDGNGDSTPKPAVSEKEADSSANSSKMFKRPPRPARPGQENPFQLGDPGMQSKSAFSKIMANHAEDSAWASAAASESASRGKPSYQRTCPFYKILPGFYICVDAFRYGAVKGQQAYFLSHFHSDHYVGLTSSWAHGPIYCSRVTANLVRQQLRVDPKWVVDLEFEEKIEVPGTEGVHVTMIPANHCPGSSLFLFEKEHGKGKAARLQRVLHCGDFRACQAHIEHPLLRPEVLDAVSGKNRQQKLDVCYLDTTYLNPKYAFPPQDQVIKACADMCVSLNKTRVDGTDGWEKMKRQRAGEGMVNFIRKDSEPDTAGQENKKDAVDPMSLSRSSADRGRLLVVVGTYSIGKERICMGVAKALNSKIYAPPNKQRICKALEDAELNELFTKDPREAQVHMTPLFEIRSDTLEDYLRDYRDCFSRAVAFRPSGWNYRPPGSRSLDNPTVQSVLYSQNWKTSFSMRDLVPQRGSTSRASCFGVPYSEHSSFRELSMFCCALKIDKIIPTVNIGNAKTREKMKVWCEKWAAEKKKNGLFRLNGDGSGW